MKQSLNMILVSMAIIVSLIGCCIASYTDLKSGIIPFKLTFLLIIFGILINSGLSIFNLNIIYIFISITSLILTFGISYVLWYFNMWGGGDALLISGLSALLPFQITIGNFNLFNGLNNTIISINYGIFPFSFVILINSIIIAFPIIVGILLRNHIKNILNSKENMFNYSNIIQMMYFNLSYFISRSCESLVSLSDLEEGMILGNYYFNDVEIFNKIKSLSSPNKNYNIKIVQKNIFSQTPTLTNNSKYCLMSKSSKGLTKDDIKLLNELFNSNLLSKNLFIKIGIPFAPFICLGFIFSVFCGNLVYVLLSFI